MGALDGHVALVTGASSGIGRASALAMARAGARLVVDYHASPEGAREVVEQIERDGGQAIAVQADVSDEDSVRDLFAAACEAFGTVHVLLANAGIQKDAALTDMTLDDWQAVLGVNLTGQFLCAREAVRVFRERGPDPDVTRALGKIVCMSSVHEIIPWAGHANYAASKGGIGMLMRTLAQELAGERIRVNGIAPGAIATPINEHARDTEDERKKLLELIPYGRIGDPEDVARAAVWLASDDADYITGHTLVVDGGMCLYPEFRDNG